MTIYYVAYSSTGDAIAQGSNATYATARNLTSATTTTATTSNIGQNTGFNIFQYFGVFDTSAIPAGSGAGSLSLSISSPPGNASDSFELRQASAATTGIAGDSLASLTLFGSAASPGVSQFTRWTLSISDITGMTRSSSCNLLLHSQKQRLATAPGGTEATIFNLADASGTTNDPFLSVNVGAGWVFVGTSATVEATATPLTLTEPAGVANGDLLIATISSRSTATTAPTATGWTAVGSQNNNNILSTGSAIASGAMLYQIRAGAPTLAFTLPAGISVAQGRITAYRGNATTTPLDVLTAVTAAAGTAVSVTGLTTTQDDDLIVAMTAGGQEATWANFTNVTTPIGVSGAVNTTTAPSASAWIKRAETVTTTGVDTSLGVFDAVRMGTGATGNLTVTASVSAGHVVVAGAFKIAPSGPTAYTLPAVGGTYALTGVATSTELGREVLSVAGAYALTGQSAILSQVAISVPEAWNANDKTTGVTLSNGSYTASLGTAIQHVRSTRTHAPSGRYYAEMVSDAVPHASEIGVASATVAFATQDPWENGASIDGAGDIYLVGNPTPAANVGLPAAGDVVSVAADYTNGKVWFRLNAGNWNGSGTANPATNTGGLTYTPADDQALFVSNYDDGSVVTVRTETASFTQSVPSGFTAWVQPIVNRTLPAVAGAYALTGATAGLYRGREVLGVAGSYGLTGQPTSLEYGREIAADPGSYVLSGQATSLELGKEVLALGGNYALSGATASLLYARRPVAVSGSYTLSGQVTSLELGKEIAVVSGSYSMTGASASLRHAYRPVVVGGSYVLTGTPVNLLKPGAYALIGLPGSYALTGTATSLEKGREVAADAGSYALSGDATSLEYGREIAAVGGSYTLSGQTTSLERGREVAANVGSYALTGLPANLLKAGARAIIALPGAYALTGRPATLLKSGVALTGVGVWTGSAWVQKPAKVWTGSAWVQKPIKVWTGSAWV